ncbi:MAG: hypothetical protein H7242_07310 [Microbacteriaceae bacterium]|nr:hypothetical protein [Burkholderiaceae bacterium]
MNAFIDQEDSRSSRSEAQRPARTKLVCAALCLVSTIAGIGAAPSAFAAGAIRAAYVETVLPSKPLSEFLANGTQGSGSASGVLGITSLTLVNAAATKTPVFIFAIGVVGPTCDSAEVSGNSRILAYVVVPPDSTLHLTYPSPLVVSPINGFSCIRMNPKPGLTVMFNGFIN